MEETDSVWARATFQNLKLAKFASLLISVIDFQQKCKQKLCSNILIMNGMPLISLKYLLVFSRASYSVFYSSNSISEHAWELLCYGSLKSVQFCGLVFSNRAFTCLTEHLEIKIQWKIKLMTFLASTTKQMQRRFYNLCNVKLFYLAVKDRTAREFFEPLNIFDLLHTS